MLLTRTCRPQSRTLDKLGLLKAFHLVVRGLSCVSVLLEHETSNSDESRESRTPAARGRTVACPVCRSVSCPGTSLYYLADDKLLPRPCHRGRHSAR